MIFVAANGAELDFDDYALHVDGADGRWLGRAEFTEAQTFGRAGSRLRRIRKAPVEVAIPVLIEADNHLELWTRQREMAQILNPELGIGRLVSTSPLGDTRELRCIYASGLEMSEEFSAHDARQKAVLVFRAFDPYWYDTEDQSSISRISEGAIRRPFFQTLTYPVNLLTQQQASLEDGTTTGWVNNTNATLSNSTAVAKHGVRSLGLTAIAAGTMSAATSPTNAVPVSADGLYLAVASFQTAVTARSVSVGVNWRTAADASISTTMGVAVTDTSTGMTRVIFVGQAPTTAAFGRVVVQVASAALGELHLVDGIALISAEGRNILDPNQATFELGVTDGWTAASGATAVAVTQDFVAEGSYALEVLAVTGGAAGPYASTHFVAGNRRAVVELQPIAITAKIRVPPGQTNRNCRLVVTYHTSGGGLVTQQFTSYAAVSDADFTTVTFTNTVPATSAVVGVAVQAQTSTTGERWIVDQVAVKPGSSDTTYVGAYDFTQANQFFPFQLSASSVLGDPTVTNDGDADAWPTWEIFGPGTDLILTNTTTGKSLRLNYTISPGETVLIDPSSDTPVTNQDGANLYRYLSSDSALFPLIPGANDLHVEFADATKDAQVELRYRRRYVSV